MNRRLAIKSPVESAKAFSSLLSYSVRFFFIIVYYV
jgi:hypothetical protein